MGGGAYPGKTNYLFSRTINESPEPGIQVVSARAEDFVRELKNGSGGEICVMGGGEFAQVLFNAGLIDEVGANIHPLLLGSGIPLFQPLVSQIGLERISCEPLEGGCVYVLYRVQKDL
jgi:dihydrofolate reductase